MSNFQPEVLDIIGTAKAVSTVDAGPRRILTPRDSYDGASYGSKETNLWAAPIRSADGDILPEKMTADARSRDMIRNDSFAQSAVGIHKDSIVGSNYMLNMRPNSKLLFGTEDTKWEDEFSEEIESLFTLNAESPECWLDASRSNTFTELVRLAVGVSVPYGELLATAEWDRENNPMRPCKTCIQMVDPDRLSTPKNVALSNRDVRGGVLRSPSGAAKGYWIRDSHPGETYMRTVGGLYDWTYSPARLPWGRKQVIHIYEQQRPDQTRGISAMVAALKEMRMAKKWREISIQNAVLNATYAASIESELPTEAIFARLGGGGANVDAAKIREALNAYIGGYFKEIGQYMGGARQIALDGVKIPHLPPGAKLELRPAGKGGPLGTDFEASLIRYFAAGTGVSYEEVSRNFSGTNYSGFKGAMALTQRSMAAKKKFTADRFATDVMRLWFEEKFNNGQFETLKRRRRLDIYDGQTFDILTACDWIGASAGQIDELKETQAAVLRMNAGISTMADECAKLGKDWRQLLRQLAREKEWKKFYKVLEQPVDSQNMMNATSDASNKDGQNTSEDQ